MMWALLDIYSSGVFWLLFTIVGDRVLQERQGAFALTPDRLRPSEWSLPMASNESAFILRQRIVSFARKEIARGTPNRMPAQSWETLAAVQSEVLLFAGVNGADPAAIAALLAGKSGRVTLALLDRADLRSNDWRKVLLSARLPAAGVAPADWSIADEDGNVLDEPPDTPGRGRPLAA